MLARDLAVLLDGHRYIAPNEGGLQVEIARQLRASGVEFAREVVLDARSRIDFVVGRVGLEVKVDSFAAEIARQLQRYAESDRLDEILLVTTRFRHMPLSAAVFYGKPVTVLRLGSFL